jgi:hypothetical protein
MPTYAPNYKVVPCLSGTLATVNIINAAVWGKRRVPQPFSTFLDAITVTDIVLPVGYIGQAYEYDEGFGTATTMTVSVGSLPPGLALVQITSTSWKISGTPTTLGTYNFTLHSTRGAAVSDVTTHITILANPDEGIGAVGGG